ncbi:hypothetical protein PENSOL_c069G07387 [Penicillium solitum]|uniref:ABC transporter domain-containing protein n=1 Tax=Penicillium solitum TaxID=60172 RepID=A0A1V6QHC0_9EURO|nr:uncharacterized protein PENSOL_c069G07387 [Penicillium solitum]OQD88621.1 hypothetical protein PENSOL_c069G07387 [Penicillium solitum]
MSDSASSTIELGHEAVDHPHKRQSATLGSSDKSVEEKCSIKAVNENGKQVTVTWSGMSIHVPASEAVQGDTLWSDMLVLGRPGEGCLSLLKILSNDRDGFGKVDGSVHYANLDHNQAAKFRQQLMFNNEDDIHFLILTVDQTIKFALRNKTPAERPEGMSREGLVEKTRDEIRSSLGILHTKRTLVGNEFFRGVSGGERKRVSLAEVMADQSPVQCWDQSTRGLDASSALDFAKSLRSIADEQRKTIIASLYQAGNAIYDQFDKVMVIAAGQTIYYGPRHLARPYFEEMGFVCGRDGSTYYNSGNGYAVYTPPPAPAECHQEPDNYGK